MSDYFMQNSIATDNFNSKEIWSVMSGIEYAIKQKIEKLGTPLKEWQIQINYGIKTGFNEAFIINSETKDSLIAKSPKNAEIIRPILLGRDIKRYSSNWNNLWIINSHNGVKSKNVPRVNLEKDFPTIYEYLLKFRDKLEIRNDQGDHWTNLRNCAYIEDFKKPKIAWGNLSQKSQFTFIDSDFFINAPSPFFLTENLYFLAFLNSAVGEFYIKSLGVSRNGGYIEFKPMFVEQMPIPKLDQKKENDYALLVRQILDLKKSGLPTDGLELKINKMIFSIFNFSEKEIDYLFAFIGKSPHNMSDFIIS